MFRQLGIGVRGAVLVVILAVWSLTLSAQDVSVEGKVFGRVIEDHKGSPLSQASLRLVEVDEQKVKVLLRATTAADGTYTLNVGRRSGRFYLLVSADGLAPRVIGLPALSDGWGIACGDIRLEAGAPLVVETTGTVGVSSGLRLQIYPPELTRPWIDADGEALLDVPLQNGKVTVSNLGRGEWVLVLSDRANAFKPRVIPWFMDGAPVILPPIAMNSGVSSEWRVASAGDETGASFVRVGTGDFDPRGGPEYRLSYRVPTRALTPGVFQVQLAQIPPGMVDLEFHGRERLIRTRFVAGERVSDGQVAPRSGISGRVVDAQTGRVVPEAEIVAGGLRTRTDQQGNYRLDGLADGLVEVYGLARGYASAVAGPLRVRPGELRSALNFALERNAILSGRVVDERNEVVAGAWISLLNSPIRGETLDGRIVVAKTDQDGRFQALNLPTGDVRLVAWTPTGRREVQDLHLVPNLAQTTTFRIPGGGEVHGRIFDTPERPSLNTRVVLLESGQDPAGDPWLSQINDPLKRVRRTWTDKTGGFHFSDVHPGSYQLWVSRNGEGFQFTTWLDVFSGASAPRGDYLPEIRPRRELSHRSAVPLRVRPPSGHTREHWLTPASVRRTVPDWPTFIHEVEGFYPIPEWTLLNPPMQHSWRGDLENEGRYYLGSVDGVLQVAAPATAPFHKVQGLVSLSGSVMGERRAELTAFPVRSLAGYPPIRGISRAGDGTFEFELPRGVWFVRANVAGYGEGHFGPICVGTEDETGDVRDLHLSVEPWSIVRGEFAPGHLANEHWIHARTTRSLWMVPFEEPGQWNLVDADGSFALAFIPELRSLFESTGDFDSFLRLPINSRRVEHIESDHLMFETGVIPLTWSRAAPGRNWPLPESFPMHLGRLSGSEPWLDRWDEPVYLDTRERRVDYEQAIRGSRALHSRIRPSNTLEAAVYSGTFERSGQVTSGWIECLPERNGAFDSNRPTVRIPVDEEGRFFVPPMEHGSYQVRRSWLGDDQRVNHDVLRVNFEGSGPDPRVWDNIRTVETAPLNVQVMGPDGDNPLEGAVVHVYLSTRRGVLIQGADPDLAASAITGPDGIVRFTNLSIGLVDVHVTHDRFGAVVRRDLEVRKARVESEIRVQLGSRGSIYGRVESLLGEGLSDARIQVFELDGGEVFMHRRFISNERGEFRIFGIQPGTYRLRAACAGFKFQDEEVVEIFPGGTARPIFKSGRQAGRIQLSVRDERGLPVINASISALEVLRPPVLTRRSLLDLLGDMHLTDAKGHLSLDQVSAGVNRLRIEHPDFDIFECEIDVPEGERVVLNIGMTRNQKN